MKICEKHRMTVAGEDCPLCSDEKVKRSDELCAQCVY